LRVEADLQHVGARMVRCRAATAEETMAVELIATGEIEPSGMPAPDIQLLPVHYLEDAPH
jgi:hypothetical protein